MTTLSQSDLAALIDRARAAPRKRSHLNVHPSLDAAVQRLAIAMEPETYVRPHRHPQTWELYLPLAGSFKVIVFDANGIVSACHTLGGEEGLRAFELPANTWHSVVSLQPGSIIFEIKEGPYIQPVATDVAQWSPPEDSAAARDFHQRLRDAKIHQHLALVQV